MTYPPKYAVTVAAWIVITLFMGIPALMLGLAMAWVLALLL